MNSSTPRKPLFSWKDSAEAICELSIKVSKMQMHCTLLRLVFTPFNNLIFPASRETQTQHLKRSPTHFDRRPRGWLAFKRLAELSSLLIKARALSWSAFDMELGSNAE